MASKRKPSAIEGKKPPGGARQGGQGSASTGKGSSRGSKAHVKSQSARDRYEKNYDRKPDGQSAPLDSKGFPGKPGGSFRGRTLAQILKSKMPR